MKNVSKINRRVFLKNFIAGVSAVSLENYAMPAKAFAAGNLKSLVVVQLAGGMDPMLAFPYTMESNFVRDLRGDIASVPFNSGLLEIAPGLAVHPGLKNLFQLFGGSTKVLKQVGNAFNLVPSRSHEAATNLMLTGGVGSSTDRYAWTGRLYDKGITLHGLGGDSMYFNCHQCKEPPLKTEFYENFDISSQSFYENPNAKVISQGGQKNADFVSQTIRQLNSIVPNRPVSDVELAYRSAQKKMFSSIDEINKVLDPKNRSPRYDQYSNIPLNLPASHHGLFSAFSTKFRNISQKLNQMKNDGESDRILFIVSLGGFDMHNNWITTGDALMSILGTTLLNFRMDLNAMGLDGDVATICTTEFGRTIKANGSGTDHGVGYSSFVTGGNINGGLFGNILKPSELSNLVNKTGNAWPREISHERIIVELLEKHLGVPGNTAFPEPLYAAIPSYADLKLFRKT